MKNILIIVLSLILSTPALIAQSNQDKELALEYYKKGDYEKAVVLYQKLFEQNKGSTYFFKYYYNCLMALEDYPTVEKVVKKQIKKYPQQLQYRVDLGYIYYSTGRAEDAANMYGEAIEALSADRSQVARLANAFNIIKEYKYAIQTYEKGKKLVKDYKFNYELANLYNNQGEIKKMITHYLEYLIESPGNVQQVKTSLQRTLSSEDDFTELQTQLYQRIQQEPENIIFPELLIWNFIQSKDFESALIQVKALDRRFKEDGTRVYDLGQSAHTEEDYDAAIAAFNYLIEKGPGHFYYYPAKNSLLQSRKAKVLNSNNFTDDDIRGLQAEYSQYIEEYNRKDAKLAGTLRELAHLEAFYVHDLEKAIALLEDVISWPALNTREKSATKLDLGDYLLMIGEIWDATLLYSQVDKSMKDEPLGEEARFKNAKLTYYRGDFEWAQTQLDVLKASTSELVANDALDLSVFITENLGLDTTLIPMQIFARADLLAFQNKDEESIKTVDSIQAEFPNHMLDDNIYFLKASIATKRQNYTRAAELYEIISSQYADDILADDALFNLAQLYENQLGDPDKAREIYQKIILYYKDSIYVIDARKQFRKLRGDAF